MPRAALRCFHWIFSVLNGVFWGRWWNLLLSRSVTSALLCPKPSFTWPMHQEFSVICLMLHMCNFLPFPSLLSLLFPKPSDILCYIWGASVDQSPPRIKQRAACNPYGYKQGLSLTETRFCAAFSAAYQTWFKGSFWFHKETLFCPSPNSSQGGGGEKKAQLHWKKRKNSFLEILEKDLIYPCCTFCLLYQVEDRELQRWINVSNVKRKKETTEKLAWVCITSFWWYFTISCRPQSPMRFLLFR